MGLLKLFAGKTPKDLETRGDDLFEAGEYGLAKMEYDKGLDKCRKKSPRDMEQERRLADKARRSREALALQHKQEGLEILESDYDEAAEECFLLALALTEEPELVRELEALLDRTRQRRKLEVVPPDPDADLFEEEGGETDISPDIDEIFTALLSPLPVQIRKAFLSYGEAFKEGYVALNEGRFERSAERLQEALEENPGGDRILPELATAYLNLEMHTEAWDLAESFLKAHPDELQGYHVLSEVLWALGRYDTAIKRLDAAPASLEGSLPLLLLRGETLLKAGHPDEAELLYKEFLDTEGFNPETARALAGVYEAMGRKEEARDMYGRLLNECSTCAGPSDPFPKSRFALLSFELGERTPALLKIFMSLVREDPEKQADYYDKINSIQSAI
ncbi:MAG: hypothetical protein R6V25_08475 [Desulfatiglandales bacterium]